jgi:hypothetical protein
LSNYTLSVHIAVIEVDWIVLAAAVPSIICGRRILLKEGGREWVHQCLLHGWWELNDLLMLLLLLLEWGSGWLWLTTYTLKTSAVAPVSAAVAPVSAAVAAVAPVPKATAIAVPLWPVASGRESAFS